MAHFTDLPQQQHIHDGGGYSSFFELGNSLTILRQLYDEIESFLDGVNFIGEMHEEKKLQSVSDLCEITLSICEQDIKLLTIQIKELINSKIDLKEELEEFITETKCKSLLYRLRYMKCDIILRCFLRKVELVTISNVPRGSQEELCVLLSIFEEYMQTYHCALSTCGKAFEEYETLMVNYFGNYNQKSDQSYKILVEAINKARTICTEIGWVAIDLVNFDCATRGLY